ncbi:uncharacterized protein LOC135685619 [Rhopilema esculentum]|uniref:uncharacterized protein LOC135685619 n=1 Tax=Rhopilema esculentum TaxID=499914 RepID=UPI0031D308E2
MEESNEYEEPQPDSRIGELQKMMPEVQDKENCTPDDAYVNTQSDPISQIKERVAAHVAKDVYTYLFEDDELTRLITESGECFYTNFDDVYLDDIIQKSYEITLFKLKSLHMGGYSEPNASIGTPTGIINSQDADDDPCATVGCHNVNQDNNNNKAVGGDKVCGKRGKNKGREDCNEYAYAYQGRDSHLLEMLRHGKETKGKKTPEYLNQVESINNQRSERGDCDENYEKMCVEFKSDYLKMEDEDSLNALNIGINWESSFVHDGRHFNEDDKSENVQDQSKKLLDWALQQGFRRSKKSRYSKKEDVE